MKIHSSLKITFLSLILISLTACKVSNEDKENIDEAFNPPTIEDPADTSEKAENCETERFVQPSAEVVKKLDLLFVVDTSGSLNEERRGIANGIDAFVQELPADVDLQVGVMYAHGQESNHSGELTGNPAVLSSSTLTIDQIRTKLFQRMDSPRTENSTDGGEVGMYTLLNSLTAKYEVNKAGGFYRDDAALAVVFVADENAICSLGSYPQGVTPVYDPNRMEQPAYDRYCDGVTPQAIVNRVRDIKGEKPFLISGIVYTGENSFSHSGENEIGYGYLETIDLANGIAIDLASGDYEVGMREIGYLTYKKLNLKTEFNLTNRGFKQDSIEVKVDQTKIEHSYIEALNQVQINEVDAGGEKSEVLIKYCFQEETPPARISELRIFGISFNQAKVSCQTDQPVTSVIRVLRIIDGQEQIINNDDLKTSHLYTLTGLQDNSDYKVVVTVTNEQGMSTEKEVTFKTLNLDDFLL